MKKLLGILVLGLLLSGCVVSDTQMKQTTTETGIKLESKIKEINKRILTPKIMLLWVVWRYFNYERLVKYSDRTQATTAQYERLVEYSDRTQATKETIN